MSKSIHITIKDFRGLKKEEIDKQVCEPSSDLNKWSEKSKIEKEIKLERKRKKKENKKRTHNTVYNSLLVLAHLGKSFGFSPFVIYLLTILL